MARSATPDSPDQERALIRRMLAGGLDTDWKHRAYEDADVQRVIAALKALPVDDLEGRLRIAGFTLEPYVSDEAPEIEQSCRTCMYFELHRRYCALPELAIHVEPEWSCNVWRI